MLKTVNFVLYKTILPYEAEICPDIFLGHYGLGIVIHPNVTIGKRVKIWHHVTLAAQTRPGSKPRLFIGDDCEIGAGAVVLGAGDADTYIGAGVKIGANAVVVGDVAPGQVMVGVPARPLAPRIPA